MIKNVLKSEIGRIAIPSIVANITIPLLGLLDITIAGHLGGAAVIGAVAVGSMIFNILYWGVGFLRMGTSGLTAQAYGAHDQQAQATLLQQSVGLAIIIALAMVALQIPIRHIAMRMIGPGHDVSQLATTYFNIVVWGAPPTLMMMSIKGWLLGMQDSRNPMIISISVNVLNIIFSLVAVFAMNLGFAGIAWGTLAGVWAGLAITMAIVARRHPSALALVSIKTMFNFAGARRFFSVNRDIFLRTLAMMAVTTFFMAVGARSGDLLLAVNSLIMQLFTLFSYFMDGVANAGEALAGKYYGARDGRALNLTVNHLFGWAAIITAMFTLLYLFSPYLIFNLLTSDPDVVNVAMDYRLWCALVPVAGAAAFVWDGVFIGTSRTQLMLLAVAVGSIAFFSLFFILPPSAGNHRLWAAFIAYLALRSIVQSVAFYCHTSIKKS